RRNRSDHRKPAERMADVDGRDVLRARREAAGAVTADNDLGTDRQRYPVCFCPNLHTILVLQYLSNPSFEADHSALGHERFGPVADELVLRIDVVAESVIAE